jgi:hypothetical protein
VHAGLGGILINQNVPSRCCPTGLPRALFHGVCWKCSFPTVPLFPAFETKCFGTAQLVDDRTGDVVIRPDLRFLKNRRSSVPRSVAYYRLRSSNICEGSEGRCIRACRRGSASSCRSVPQLAKRTIRVRLRPGKPLINYSLPYGRTFRKTTFSRSLPSWEDTAAAHPKGVRRCIR